MKKNVVPSRLVASQEAAVPSVTSSMVDLSECRLYVKLCLLKKSRMDFFALLRRCSVAWTPVFRESSSRQPCSFSLCSLPAGELPLSQPEPQSKRCHVGLQQRSDCFCFFSPSSCGSGHPSRSPLPPFLQTPWPTLPS